MMINVSVQYNSGLLSDIILLTLRDYIVCVCVFFPSILDIKFVGRTSRGHTGGRSHRIFNPLHWRTLLRL